MKYGSIRKERNNDTVELAFPRHHANGEEEPIREEATSTTALMDIEDAMERLGMGRFQYEILLAAGLCFAADAMEVLLLSFLAMILLQVKWELQGHQMDSITSVVFAGAMLGTLVLSPVADLVYGC